MLIEPLNILIVDDNETILDTLLFILSEKNFSVESAINGEKALEKININKPDLIISDNEMPIMNGITFYKTIKNNHKTKHIPFIFCTACDFEEITDKINITKDNYIRKPFEIDELFSKIKQAITTQYPNL